MRGFRFILYAGLCAVSTARVHADNLAIRSVLQAILAEPDDARLPGIMNFERVFESVSDMAQSEVQEILPLAERCLLSERRAVRPYGGLFFFAVALRMDDGTELVTPYIDDFGPLLNDPDIAMRNGAIFLLGSSHPKPAAKGIAYLTAHMGSQTDTAIQFNMVAAAILSATPDAGTARKVLDAARRRTDLEEIRGVLIETFGIVHLHTPEVIGFIKEAFLSTNPGMRMGAIEAVRRMPPELRKEFAMELQAVMANTEESSQQRDRARQVFIMR